MIKQKAFSTKKQLAFSQQMLKKANLRASNLGISFADYVRFLIVQDTKDLSIGVPFTIDLPKEAERKYQKEAKDFEIQEKKRSTPGATSARELVEMLNNEED